MANGAKMTDMHDVAEVSFLPDEPRLVEDVVLGVALHCFNGWEFLDHLESGIALE